MNNAGIGDTVAWKIMRQIMDHMFGADEDMSENDCISIMRIFTKTDGLWYDVIRGDPKTIEKLENSIKLFVQTRKQMVVASKIAFRHL